MRHLLYWLSLAAASLTALILALPFAMSECQLLSDSQEVATCFAANARGWRAYGLGVIVFAGMSLFLYARGSRRAIASALAVAIGPFVVAMLFASTVR